MAGKTPIGKKIGEIDMSMFDGKWEELDYHIQRYIKMY